MILSVGSVCFNLHATFVLFCFVNMPFLQNKLCHDSWCSSRSVNDLLSWKFLLCYILKIFVAYIGTKMRAKFSFYWLNWGLQTQTCTEGLTKLLLTKHFVFVLKELCYFAKGKWKIMKAKSLSLETCGWLFLVNSEFDVGFE